MTNISDPIVSDDDLIKSLQARHAANLKPGLDGHAERRKLYLETALAYGRLGKDNAALIKAAEDLGAKKRKGQDASCYLAPGLVGVKLKDYTGDAYDKVKGRLQTVAGVLKAADHLAGPHGGLANIDLGKLGGLFGDATAFQKAVKATLRDIRTAEKATVAGDFTIADFQGEDDAAEVKATARVIETLKAYPSIAEVTGLKLSQPGRLFVLVGLDDEDGTRISRQLQLGPEQIAALLPKDDLSKVDGMVNGVAEAFALAKYLFPDRTSSYPLDADETVTKATRMRQSTRTMLIKGTQLEVSLGHVDQPTMLMVTTLNDPAGTGVTEPHVVLGSSRRVFESIIIPEHTRVAYKWGGLTKPEDKKNRVLRFTRSDPDRVVDIGLIPAGDWGDSIYQKPFAHRLSAEYSDVGVRTISDEVLARLKAEVLDDKTARKVADVVVRMKEGNLLIKLGTASNLQYDAALDGGRADEFKLNIGGEDFRLALSAAMAGTTDDQVGISGDARGVVRIQWNGRGAKHAVYIAKKDGDRRDSAGLFQRYDRMTFPHVVVMKGAA
ncbi:MAG: hypothetical protein PSV23_01020 [Brevundimonas sp.]|uniref:hypothetical protein n=1 Tax=Brevundimonas sp. TaxID=1871086 RepID=UPI0024897EE6|nr:hypothetical protein [Brevundimonas sp.]MDI1325363.1 hypothetical protein [Brevundimonas sp.]